MAPRPVISVGISPQIAGWSVILTSVCALGWYTERYQRDEDDIDGKLKTLYLENAREAQINGPKMMSALRGQDVNLDGRVNNMVWGGKANLKKKNDTDSNNIILVGNGNGNGNSNNDGDDIVKQPGAIRANNNNDAIDENDHDDKASRRRKQRKKRKRKVPKEDTDNNNNKDEESEKHVGNGTESQHQTKLIIQSSVAGIAVGAITMAAVSVIFNNKSNK